MVLFSLCASASAACASASSLATPSARAGLQRLARSRAAVSLATALVRCPISWPFFVPLVSVAIAYGDSRLSAGAGTHVQPAQGVRRAAWRKREQGEKVVGPTLAA